ncbi:MAG: PAS domain-containing protein [Planctomycetota bacterium]
MKTPPRLTGIERKLGADDLIVSKTDARGVITYANRAFLKIADYREDEVLGRPHNLIRHPDMPRAVFRLMWETIPAGREVFAYVVNRTKGGDHYWVLAHVTPSYDAHGRVVGYHSNRRAPARPAIDAIVPLYKKLLDIESRFENPKTAWQESTAALHDLLASKSVGYDEFVFSLDPVAAEAAAAGAAS